MLVLPLSLPSFLCPEWPRMSARPRPVKVAPSLPAQSSQLHSSLATTELTEGNWKQPRLVALRPISTLHYSCTYLSLLLSAAGKIKVHVYVWRIYGAICFKITQNVVFFSLWCENINLNLFYDLKKQNKYSVLNTQQRDIQTILLMPLRGYVMW
jgi:hypothetical protein